MSRDSTAVQRYLALVAEMDALWLTLTDDEQAAVIERWRARVEDRPTLPCPPSPEPEPPPPTLRAVPRPRR